MTNLILLAVVIRIIVSIIVVNGNAYLRYTESGIARDEAKILTFKLNDTYVGKVDQLSKTISVVVPLTVDIDRKSTRLNSSHIQKSRMPSSA